MNNRNDNISKASNGISSPFIAAHDRFFGGRRLIPHVTYGQLTYDFYDLGTDLLVKILTRLSPEAFLPFTSSDKHEDTLYIVDCADLEEAHCEYCDEIHVAFEGEKLTSNPFPTGALLYVADKLWYFNGEDEKWMPMIPEECQHCIQSEED